MTSIRFMIVLNTVQFNLGFTIETNNDTITKFKILGKNDFSGVYLIQEE